MLLALRSTSCSAPDGATGARAKNVPMPGHARTCTMTYVHTQNAACRHETTPPFLFCFFGLVYLFLWYLFLFLGVNIRKRERSASAKP